MARRVNPPKLGPKPEDLDWGLSKEAGGAREVLSVGCRIWQWWPEGSRKRCVEGPCIRMEEWLQPETTKSVKPKDRLSCSIKIWRDSSFSGNGLCDMGKVSGDLGIEKPYRFIQGPPPMSTCGRKVLDSVAHSGLSKRCLASLIL